MASPEPGGGVPEPPGGSDGGPPAGSGDPSEPQDGAADSLVDALDPFRGHLAFADRQLGRAWIRTWLDKSTIEPIQPLDSASDGMVDFEALEALASWQGLLRMPRTMTDDEYPLDVDERMRECQPQFILRNLGRVEKEIDPDEPMELDRQRIAKASEDEGITQSRELRYEAPDLVGEPGLGAVRDRQRNMRQLYDEIAWEQHFGAEVRADHTGPMWSYDPYAPPEVAADDEDSAGEQE